MGKRRTKCFTGCWTCRSRRVKCDEKTPSCQRCQQIGLVCEGYGIRLSWVQYDPHDTTEPNHPHDLGNSPHSSQTRVSRRSMASVHASQLPAFRASPEIDATLTSIDDWQPGDTDIGDGAFHVFSLEPLATALDNDTSTTCQIEDPLSPEDPAELEYNHLPPLEREITLSVVELPTGPLQETTNAPSSSKINFIPPSPRHLDVLSVPSQQKRLIHHWVTFTSRKIVLIDETHNPCRTMMLPMALKGLMSQSNSSNSDVAIFHALCAAAAYNLFELSDRTSEQDHILALYHDGEAVHHLRNNLVRVDEHQDQSCAMAIMACITVEAVSGTTQRWRTHVSGGLAYLNKLQSQGLEETTLSAFRQHMVKMAILCGISVPKSLKFFLYDDSGASDGLEFTFPYYGVSRSFLRAHDRINTWLENTPDNRTPEMEKELDTFELQMYLDFPSFPFPGQLPPTLDSASGAVISHTSKAFYYAHLVFFQRSVRQAPITTVQGLVELGIQELESMDRAGRGQLGCLMMWPVLVLGAECSDKPVQRRLRAWFQAQQKLGFRNLVVIEDLITRVWRARDCDANASEADWRRVISQARYDVFRL